MIKQPELSIVHCLRSAVSSLSLTDHQVNIMHEVLHSLCEVMLQANVHFKKYHADFITSLMKKHTQKLRYTLLYYAS
jgi:hypothetical protein